MGHKHGVRDTGAHFTIDQFTRQIKNDSAEKTTIVQYDHNSQRLTFEMPLYIDSHAMTLCDLIEIHYINISTDGKSQNDGTYEVNDIKAEGEKAIFTWLISQEATQLAGSLSFFIVFKCTENGVTVYRWGTEICKTLAISAGMDNGEAVLTEYPDILAQWKAQIFGAQDSAVVAVEAAKTSALAAIEAAGEAKKQSVLDSIPDEYEALSALADQNHRNKAGAIVLDAEGESIVLNDASEYPLQNLKVYGRSTQDGTPTPDAPVDIVSVENPVVAVCGKNLAYNQTDYNVELYGLTIMREKGTSTAVLDGTVTKLFSYVLCTTDVLPVGKYSVSVSGLNIYNEADDRAYVYDIKADKTIVNYIQPGKSKCFEITEPKAVRIDGVFSVDSAYNNQTIEIMLEAGEVASPYEPHKASYSAELAHTLPGIPVSSGGNYTDENGQQWICDEVDLERGVYVQRTGMRVLEGAEVWTEGSTVLNNMHRYYIYVNDMFPTSAGYGLCTHYLRTNLASHDITSECVRFGDSNQALFFFTATITDVESWKTYVTEQYERGTPIRVEYVLATPIETPLSEAEINAFKALHTNKPNTTILNDAGAYMAARYVADTKTYIDNRIKEMMEEVE